MCSGEEKGPRRPRTQDPLTPRHFFFHSGNFPATFATASHVYFVGTVFASATEIASKRECPTATLSKAAEEKGKPVQPNTRRRAAKWQQQLSSNRQLQGKVLSSRSNRRHLILSRITSSDGSHARGSPTASASRETSHSSLTT